MGVMTQTKPGFWKDHFHPFTITHLCVLIVFAIFITGIVSLRKCDDVAEVPFRRRYLDKGLGWVALLAACFVQIATLWPSRFDARTSLPLHICDIGMFVSPLALILKWRPLRTISYFWGLGLSSLAFIYPDLRFGVYDFQFWVFWLGHAATVGPAAMTSPRGGFRPHWKDWRFAVVFSTAYVAVMFPIDAHFHVNYGYVGPTLKGQTSPFDKLGPWPWHVAAMYGIAMVVMLALFVPRALWRLHSSSEIAEQTQGEAGLAVPTPPAPGPITGSGPNRSPKPVIADS